MVIKKIFNFIKSYKRSILISLGIGVFVSGVTLLSINWTNLNIIYAAGSSAVAPLMESLSQGYQLQKNAENIDVNVSNTGSGNGIEVIVNGTKNLGNVSRSPTIKEAGNPALTPDIPAQSGQFSNQWKDKRLKTITLGWDAICVIYKPSNAGWSLNIDKDNIGFIYQTISGVRKSTFKDLEPNNTFAPNDNIIPFARTGGAVKSGTTEAFIKDSNLIFSKDEQTTKAINVLSNGSYSSNVRATKESNIETWKAISSQGGAIGSMTYLSGGFVLNNRADIEKNGFKVADYEKIPFEHDKITSGYNWYRPLNTIVSLSNIPNYLITWLYWVLDYNNNDKVEKIFGDAGVVILTPTQLGSMAIPHPDQKDERNFLVSDYELMIHYKQKFFGAR